VAALSVVGDTSEHDGPVAHVDLSALQHNVAALRARLAAGTELLAAVKADAYGHGAATVVPALQAFGVDRFGVATAAEALALRAAGVTAPILLFGPVVTRVAELVAADVALTVPDEASLRALEAASAGARARVHVKLDSGMGRLGVRSEEALPLVRAVAQSRAATLEGVWTHLADADDPDAASEGSHTCRQLARFGGAVAELEAAGLRPPLVHAANSAATLVLSASHLDLVRPGIAIYGHHASASVRAAAGELLPALTLTAPVTFVKRVRRGDTIGYGASWRAPRDTVVATVRIGYADGYPRALGNRASMRLQGRDVAVVGRVCMDQLMLDVGALDDVAVGDVAIAFGRDGPDTEGLAELAGTVSYELLTRLGARVARSYGAGPRGR
jgi:alanine racemase